MGSSPEHGQPEVSREDVILLDRNSLRITLKQLCSQLTFILVTLLMAFDLATDIWVIVLFGRRKDTVYAPVMAGLFLAGSLVMAAVHCAQKQSADTGSRVTAAILFDFVLDFPLQLAVLYHRLLHTADRCRHCCPKRISARAHAPAHGDVEWKMAELKLVHSVYSSTPQLIGNVVHMLMYEQTNPIQLLSVALSFSSVILGFVIYEKASKERSRGAHVTGIRLLCIFVYKTLVIGTRLLAIAHFVYYFGPWTAAILSPHVVLMLTFNVCLYGRVWRVRCRQLLEHSVYSVLVHSPVLSEYRPEGELAIFYVLFMSENILMVALPFKMAPTMPVGRRFGPGSRYYFIVMLVILIGSTLGLVFMSVYYFFFHRSRQTIRDTHLGWLASLWEWRRNETGSAASAAILNGQHGAAGGGGGGGQSASSRDRSGGQTGDRQAGCDDDVIISASDRRDVADHSAADADASLLTGNVVRFVTSSANPEPGSQSDRLLIRDDDVIEDVIDNRPSVLDGDDEMADEQRHIVVV